MAGPMEPDRLCAKDPVPYGLDTISSRSGARARRERLRDAIRAQCQLSLPRNGVGVLPNPIQPTHARLHQQHVKRAPASLSGAGRPD